MNWTNKKVLVTGGAGFIGSHLVEVLVAKKAKVTVVDDLSRGDLTKIQSSLKQINFQQLDLTEKKSDQVFADQDVAFNLAALNTGVDYDLGKTAEMFSQNMLLQMMPIRFAAKHGVKRFIQVSSASVYSRRAMEKQVPTPETADKTSPEPSKQGYAYAKLMGEKLAKWYSLDSSMETVIARFINVYGERDHFDELGHFIPVITKKIIGAQDEVEVFGSGRQRRSFLYVKDAVEALLILAEKGENGEPYNVDSSEEHSVAEVVKKIMDLTDKQYLKVNFNTQMPEGSQRRLLDSSKLKKLGWAPSMNFNDGLEKVVRDVEARL